jgi:protein-tyrosine phosphatase
MIRVLFVCAGNICRSPMAEAVFAQQVKEAGLQDAIKVDSAGTGNWHVGDRADSRTINLLQKNKIDYDGRARQLQRGDAHDFDYIVMMDDENLANIEARFANLAHKAEVKLLLHYANTAGLTQATEVPDPYYDGTFDRVYDLVTLGGKALLAHIRQTHKL